MAFSPTDLANDDFLFSYLAEYLDGDLPKDLAGRFEQLTKGQEKLPDQFNTTRGRLQLSLQSYYLKDVELAELRAMVQDPTVKATKENTKIEQLGRGEIANMLVRRLVLVAIAAGIIGFAIWKFGPSREQKFKPLEYLGYEAVAIEEDPRERVNLPSHDVKEVRQYLASYPGLDFKPKMLKQIAKNWDLDGATIIDYEVAKVATVIYSNNSTKEKLFHFSYAGELSDLPPSEPGNMRGLIFQTYASDELNLIAWQSAPGVVSLLVGRRSAPELAEIALAGRS